MLEGVCREMSGDVSLWLFKARSGVGGSMYLWLSLCCSHSEG